MRIDTLFVLCFIFASSLVAGFPASSQNQDTNGPTKIDLLASRKQQTSSTTEPATSTTAGSNNKRSYTNPSHSEISTSSKPVVDEGDRTRKESDSSTPALRYIQSLLVNVLQPQPIVDTIKEEDKYGNDGEKLGQVGRSIVGGVEKITNFISSTVDLPFDALKSFTRKASETLNNIGAKIVGI
ncbi:uncharacterized protein [Periplaneta americana]|uniref:uncharacterized protein n=1 Tax=Periplaneta americana TaxID=6978 RepID=UPI0037E90065